MFKWKVKAAFHAVTAKGFEKREEEREVIAQNENDAWAKFCDALGTWPSRRNSQVTFTKGKQVDPMTLIAAERSAPFREGM